MDTLLSLLETVRSFFMGIFSVISANMSIDLGIKLVLGYFFIIWAAFIIWVIKDITNRTTNILVQTISIFIILFFTPIFGLPIYLLIRPGSTLFEQYYEDEEVEELEDDDVEEFYHCPGCSHKVSRDFKFCPKCMLELTISCPSCKKRIHSDWALCPYCGEKEIVPKKEPLKEKKGGKIPVKKIGKKDDDAKQKDIHQKKESLKEKES
ncbi:zinc ribbon domain-containing protein [Candidatus Gracilibacteria bacterium]|nr:zinc ribbon domain-containing protein [Candidatus Gracilibacteria bacterium]OIO76210.1 MAG: hypothetical protein AUJ87_03300 [Candidatus Gracilibacteria bacterium CG1_02_38_174]PIQ12056.1 MAG: hypothetical protein COW68_00935 [Candidatus Gracilibacteria bacterium CG18_big_fil_WC_8_21_14_2_50_38_16]PIQ42239.1 MAG: hypothetical protein COW06_00170 [Candidatus Gracilibacteria bacterium CG12_big_fil_rev_8_21_14_0_65_38_15]PIZ01348.1 MAG: hypothetical protein COY60_03870 [Candidatus Gracilibacter